MILHACTNSCGTVTHLTSLLLPCVGVAVVRSTASVARAMSRTDDIIVRIESLGDCNSAPSSIGLLDGHSCSATPVCSLLTSRDNVVSLPPGGNRLQKMQCESVCENGALRARMLQNTLQLAKMLRKTRWFVSHDILGRVCVSVVYSYC